MATQDHLGLDLLVELDRDRPLRAQLEEQLRDGIRRGRLHAGSALPSTRALAAQLGVSRGVVVEAYAQLAAEGFLVARTGSATRVAAVAPHDPGEQPEARVPPAVRFDLRVEAADLAAFPRRAWLGAMREVMTDAPHLAFGYGDKGGAPELRATLAAYLGRARGVVARPTDVLVTTGMTQAVALVGRALHARGVRRAAVEDPGFPLHRMALEGAGLECVPIAVDEGGIDVGAVAAADVGAVLVTPTHQAPLGWALTPERRAALMAWATATGGVVLEDDYDGEFRFDRDPVGALQGLAPGRVVYLGSASKTLAPALRLGWAVVPASLLAVVEQEKALADGGTPQLDQLALARLIERGDLDRHLRRMRGRYRARREALVAMARELPDWPTEGIPAGLHFCARLPADLPLGLLLQRCWEDGIGIFGFPHDGVARMMLGYGNLSEPSVEPAVRALAAAARAVRDAQGRPG